MKTTRHAAAGIGLLVVVLALMLAACGGPGASGGAIDAAEAARLVLAEQERFAGIGPRDPDLIGQSSWYEVEEAQDGWAVRVRIGWGDCPSGCISEHVWTYVVGSDGTVRLSGEDGDPVPEESGIRGRVVAGPTCPVVTDPPDPSCDDRPVQGAVLVIQDLAGAEVARVTSDATGAFAVELAPGAYRVVPQDVEGLMGTAEPQEVRVEVGEAAAELVVAYDTGIR